MGIPLLPTHLLDETKLSLPLTAMRESTTSKQFWKHLGRKRARLNLTEDLKFGLKVSFSKLSHDSNQVRITVQQSRYNEKNEVRVFKPRIQRILEYRLSIDTFH